MSPRTEYTGLVTPGFVADPASMELTTGRVMDFDTVPVAYGAAGEKVVPAGTLMKEQADGTMVPQGTDALGAGETSLGLLVATAEEENTAAALSGYGVYAGGVVYEELLPEYDALGAGNPWTDTLRAAVAGAGRGFHFETYEDDRAS